MSGTRLVNQYLLPILISLLLGGCMPATKPAAPKPVARSEPGEDAAGGGEAPLDPEINLQLDQPLRVRGCYGSLVESTDSPGGVLVVSAHENQSTEAVPGIYLRAELTKDVLESPEGKTVSAQLFVQESAGAMVWHTLPEASVSLSIKRWSKRDFLCEIDRGELVATDGQSRTSVTGTFAGLLKKP